MADWGYDIEEDILLKVQYPSVQYPSVSTCMWKSELRISEST